MVLGILSECARGTLDEFLDFRRGRGGVASSRHAEQSHDIVRIVGRQAGIQERLRKGDVVDRYVLDLPSYGLRESGCSFIVGQRLGTVERELASVEAIAANRCCCRCP